MSYTYNPENFSHGCPDATIGQDTYIVTAFNPSDPSVEVDFQTGRGAWRGTALEGGKVTATMTIEVRDEDQNPPGKYTEFNYEDEDWVIKQVDFARQTGSASTWSLQLNKVIDNGST